MRHPRGPFKTFGTAANSESLAASKGEQEVTRMSLRTRLAFPLLCAALLVLAAAPAGADGWRKHHKHHHKHAKHHWKHHARHHHGGHGRSYAPRVVVRHHSYGYPVHHYGHGPSFYCGPCSHSFDSYDHLSHHVHHHHHVAAIRLPEVIFQASIGGGVGWVFDH
jgi:hypothetical protein